MLFRSFTLAVQSLLQLSSLSFTNVKAFDSTFAFSPSWMVPLSNLFLSSVDSPQLALPFLHNFASTLTSLQIFFARSLEPDAPVHPLSFTSVPLPALTHCEIYINVVQLITKWIPLSLSPIESLVITGVRNDISYWDVLFPFVRGMRETLRELVVEVEEEGSGEAQSKASRKQLREHCRARKVALEVFLVQAVTYRSVYEGELLGRLHSSRGARRSGLRPVITVQPLAEVSTQERAFALSLLRSESSHLRPPEDDATAGHTVPPSYLLPVTATLQPTRKQHCSPRGQGHRTSEILQLRGSQALGSNSPVWRYNQ